MVDEKLLHPYKPEETEKRIYALWEESGFFAPETRPSWALNPETNANYEKPFCIIMPPPNANGRLHAGHALFVTIEDIITRYKRMRGYKTLWIPGADHAGFETQIVYERELEKAGRSRFDISPENLYKEIYDFTIKNKAHMEDDIRRLGASCDWNREHFTLEPRVVKTVQETFKKMFDDGLVYRGKRIINWCSKHQTSLSDVETEFKEQKDSFYYLKYGPFTIGTARPETKFGDKYVVMHPEDARYKAYAEGQTINLEWINGPITATIIKDPSIDMEFGSGVMTITPWHDQTDFEIAERHNLNKEQIIDFKGKLLPIAGEFEGQHISKARPLIIEKLKSKGLLEKVDESYSHNVRICYKCGTRIEPQIKDQWFVKMKPLAEKALAAIDRKEITFIPENYEKIFRYWMENTIDWNISRQIIWGIRIPAFYNKEDGSWAVETDAEKQEALKKRGLSPDEDTFDTWFSSGQWTLLALGYPGSNDLALYHPTSVMETGHDLIFKWIPRMVIFSLYLRNEVPFRTVYLHGLVNDAKGQKMSKSKGNIISPIDIIEKYGTDALRMALVVGNTPGSDLALSEQKINGYKKFANKLWNVARFVLENTADAEANEKISFSPKDEEIMEEFGKFLADVTSDFDNFRFHLASEKIYHYMWHTFADKIIEESKILLKDTDASLCASRKKLLFQIFLALLKVLHPIMPFITEEIWSFIPNKNKQGLLIVEPWPLLK